MIARWGYHLHFDFWIDKNDFRKENQHRECSLRRRCDNDGKSIFWARVELV